MLRSSIFRPLPAAHSSEPTFTNCWRLRLVSNPMPHSADSLLMEADADHVTPGVTAELIGRIVQLDYSAAIAPAIAQSFADHLRDNQVAAIRLSELLTFLEPPSSTGKSKEMKVGTTIWTTGKTILTLRSPAWFLAMPTATSSWLSTTHPAC